MIDRKLVAIRFHLAFNKVLLPFHPSNTERKVGFFKVHNDQLFCHVRIPDSQGRCVWHWFRVCDATEEEKKLNHKLNVSIDNNAAQQTSREESD